MGKITGFMEYARQEAAHLSPAERLKNYEEFLLPPDPRALRLQSARCMDCGVPFCHAGMTVAGLSVGCPLQNLIPEMNDLVYRGDARGAFERLVKTNPFPEITGRVCPALCEGSCTLGEHDLPVTIEDIERYVADLALENGWYDSAAAPETGRRAAVVGSGPAGLACAERLRRLGDAVTVFERADRPGGFLMYGIPNMKLDKSFVSGIIIRLEKMGVEFRTGVEIGTDIPAAALVRDYDAVVLCGGARRERRLSVPGSALSGVHTAVDYLTGVTRSLLDGTPLPVDARGRRVVVVGGGDTGADCVASCLRQGAESVVQLEIVPCPPPRRGPGNPWPLWPRVRKTGYAHEEAAHMFGGDICRYGTTVRELTSSGENGAVAGVATVRVEWTEENGRPAPREIPGSGEVIPADLVLTAMGFTGAEELLPGAFGLERDARGNIFAGTGDSAGAGGFRTSLPGVFAAGDIRRGPSLVVWAILEGRRAAQECHKYSKTNLKASYESIIKRRESR